MGLDVTGQKKSRDKVLCPGLSWDKITTLKPRIVFVFQKLYFLFNFFPSVPRSVSGQNRTGCRNPISWQDVIILSQPVPRQDFEILSRDNGATSVPFFCLVEKSKLNPIQSYTPRYSQHWLCVQQNIKAWFKSWVIFFFTYQVFWVKKHSEFTWKFRNKILIPILFNILVLLDVHAINLPETSPFFICLNVFDEHLFQMFIVLGMYTFDPL